MAFLCGGAGGRGARVRLRPGRRDDEVLFGEGGGRFVVTVRAEHLDRMADLAEAGSTPVRTESIGTVGGSALAVTIGQRQIDLDVSASRDAHEGGLPRALA